MVATNHELTEYVSSYWTSNNKGTNMSEEPETPELPAS